MIEREKRKKNVGGASVTAKNIKKFVVLGGNLIMERFEFLRIKEFWSGNDSREADFCTTEECLRV